MKPIKLIVLFICMAVASNAQGIKFESGLSLAEILQKARNENTHVFLDIYATWCRPCKMMDNQVYNTDSAGSFFNQKFIAVKVQMDKTAKDNELVKKWYVDAESLNQKYKITAYPTFLFISPDGNLVHRGSGYQSVQKLIAMGSEALDPSKNYTGLLDRYKNKQLSFPEMRTLALKALKMEDKRIGLIVAQDYKNHYIDSLRDSEVLTKENMDFIREFPDLVTAKDRLFKIFLSNPVGVDTAANQDGFSKLFRDYVITREEINEKIWDGEKPKIVKPDWKQYENEIARKYSKTVSNSILISAKLRWYTYFKEWSEIVRYNIEFVEVNTPDLSNVVDRIMLNNMVFDVIFRHSVNAGQLRKGIAWMDQLLAKEPDHHSWIDTKANLIYKMGEQQLGIKLEEEALRMAESKNDKNSVAAYESTIQKMKSKLPTWE